MRLAVADAGEREDGWNSFDVRIALLAVLSNGEIRGESTVSANGSIDPPRDSVRRFGGGGIGLLPTVLLLPNPAPATILPSASSLLVVLVLGSPFSDPVLLGEREATFTPPPPDDDPVFSLRNRVAGPICDVDSSFVREFVRLTGGKKGCGFVLDDEDGCTGEEEKMMEIEGEEESCELSRREGGGGGGGVSFRPDEEDEKFSSFAERGRGGSGGVS